MVRFVYELWPQTLNRKPNLWGACVVREFQKLGDLTSTDSEPEASAFKVPQKAVREREREARRGEVQEERAPGRDGGQIKSASYCRDAVFYIGRKNWQPHYTFRLANSPPAGNRKSANYGNNTFSDNQVAQQRPRVVRHK